MSYWDTGRVGVKEGLGQWDHLEYFQAALQQIKSLGLVFPTTWHLLLSPLLNPPVCLKRLGLSDGPMPL